MDIFEAIRRRRSIRSFERKRVSDEDVEKLVEAASLAPSAGNIQPWEFIIVRKQETKKRLAEAALDQCFIEEASVVIVVCASERRSSQRYGPRGKTLYCIQDTAAATQNMMLAAFALGLGACWIGAFSEEEARRILEVPAGIKPVAIVPIGYSAESPIPRNRRSIDQMVHHESFSG